MRFYCIFFLLLVFAGTVLTSCSHPDRDFKNSLRQMAEDKVIDAKELAALDSQLMKALSKSKMGVDMGVDIIKDREGMIHYLIEKKGCQVEGIKPPREIRFEDFFIYLENSKSMQGYYSSGNEGFLEPIIALTQCGAQMNHTAYAGAKGKSDSEVIFSDVPTSEFLQNIAKGKFNSSESSPMDKMIEAAVDRILDKAERDSELADDKVVNDVFCLITDGLLSGTNAEIISNREFNKNSLPVLENRIRDAVQRAHSAGLHCLVYRLESAFNGTYYDYRNGHHVLQGGNRPYYMVLIGEKENLERIETQLAKEQNFTKHPNKRFATYDVSSGQTITSATFAPVIGHPAIQVAGNTISYSPKKLQTDPVVFSIKMQLKSLFPYYFDDIFQDNRLSLKYYDKPSDTHVEIPLEQWLGDLTLDQETKTCTFKVSVDNTYLNKMTMPSTSLSITLPGHQDEWYVNLSQADDSDISVGDVRSFGLDRFMGGFMKGFGYQDTEAIPDAIKVKFILVKK